VKLRPDRDDDMVITGKRHDFVCDYEIGFDDDGRIHAVDAVYAARCGWNADLSGPVTDRALFHMDNCYFYPAVRGRSSRCAPYGLQHRLSRLRRAARHGRGRALHRGGRLRDRARPAGGAQAQPSMASAEIAT
jgi:CO/xanthine dehydrogenase Mo-binding subunit